MAGRRVLTVGDVFLDEYLVGRAERLSREGPVPVLAFQRRFCLPGGAANPARNIVALGACAAQVGVVGADAAAGELLSVLVQAGIDTAGMVADPGRPTTVKTRVVAEGLSAPHQVARIDRQVRADVAGTVEAALIGAIERSAETSQAILVSHYRSGVVTPAVCDAARRAAVRRSQASQGPQGSQGSQGPQGSQACWLTVDAQGDLERFHGFHVVRVGRQDATSSLARPLETEADFEQAARGLCRELGAQVVLLGRGSAGMSVACGTDYFVVRPANVSEVYDVSGAGDTVIAVVTLALAAGAGVMEAVLLANYAAGVVVRRLGVAAPTAAEIVAEIPATAPSAVPAAGNEAAWERPA